MGRHGEKMAISEPKTEAWNTAFPPGLQKKQTLSTL